MNKFEIEFKNLKRIGGHRNVRLLSKEAAKYFFLKNCNECQEYNNECLVPENVEEVAEFLFSFDNVYVALSPCEDFFNKEGNFVLELPNNTYKSLDLDEIKNKIKKLLQEDYVVYVYTYYSLLQYVGGDNKEKTYWWRMIYKKNI